jgi:hypothetical protein
MRLHPNPGALSDPSPAKPPARASFDPSLREVRIARVLQDAPPSVRGILGRAFAGESSPRAAIQAMCLTCVGYQRDEITRCTGYSCPLWVYRPYQEAPHGRP